MRVFFSDGGFSLKPWNHLNVILAYMFLGRSSMKYLFYVSMVIQKSKMTHCKTKVQHMILWHQENKKNAFPPKITTLIEPLLYMNIISIVSFQLYMNCKERPPIPRNMPPVAGKIAWIRQLLHKIEYPMLIFMVSLREINLLITNFDSIKFLIYPNTAVKILQ